MLNLTIQNISLCLHVMNIDSKTTITKQDTETNQQGTKPNEEEEQGTKRRINRPRYLEDYVTR